MKWMERIGTALALIGVGCVLFGGGRLGSGTATETTTRILLAGILLAISGVVMVNFKSEWLWKD